VKEYNTEKGFGFIVPLEETPEIASRNWDYFVHHTVIQRPGFRFLTVGDIVEFTPTEFMGKSRAENVTAEGGAWLPRVSR